jgi:hypothetical protein
MYTTSLKVLGAVFRKKLHRGNPQENAIITCATKDL